MPGKVREQGRPDSSSSGTGFISSRRSFLKGFTFAGVTLFLGRLFAPLSRITRPGSAPALQQSETVTVKEQLTPTSCLNCPTRCGTIVRVENGNAVHVAGNPLSQLAEGKICPRGHIGLQVLYDRSRIAGPLKRTNSTKGKGIDPKWAPLSWDEALGEVSSRLESLRSGGQPHQLLLFEGLNIIANEDLIARFATAFGTPNLVTEDSLEKQSEVLGRWMADGASTHVAYDLGQTAYILAFGAGILESEKPVSRNLRMWGKMRRERPDRARVVVVDPRYSVTAVRSDQWLPIVPGTDGALALAIANVIISEGLYDSDFINGWTTGFDAFKALVLSEYTPEKAAEVTGVDVATIVQIAREFAQTKPAMAWAGRGIAAWPGGSYQCYAVFCLNALVGSIDVPGGIIYQEYPPYREMPDVKADDIAALGLGQPRLDLGGSAQFPAANTVANQVPDSILNDQPYPVAMGIGFNSNFNMIAPDDGRWEQALRKLPYYVHVAPFVSEMAQYADMILPCPTFMEDWGYDHSPPGSGFAEARIKQPVVSPLYDTRSIADIVFAIAGQMGGSVGASFAQIGDNAEGFAEYRTSTLASWDKLRQDGVWVGPEYQYRQYDNRFHTPSKKFEFRSGNLENLLTKAGQPGQNELSYLPHYEAPSFLGDASAYPLTLSVYEPLLNIENGSQNYPWAQDVYLVLHGVGWTTYAEINSVTARGLHVRDGDTIWVESPSGRIKVQARVFEGVCPGVVSISTGQGHYANGQWQQDIGANPNDIIGLSYDRLSGQSSFFNTRVKVYRA